MTQEDKIRDVKEKLNKFIIEAENSVKTIDEGSIIPNCEVYNLVQVKQTRHMEQLAYYMNFFQTILKLVEFGIKVMI